MTKDEVESLRGEQEELRNQVKVLKGIVRRLEVMLKTPCGECDYFKSELDIVQAQKECASCGRPLWSHCSVCEPRKR